MSFTVALTQRLTLDMAMALEGPSDELWRGIDGFVGYAVSNYGRVFSEASRRPILGSVDREGKLRIRMPGNDGSVRQKYIHNMVGAAFVHPRRERFFHLNGDVLDNRRSNLAVLSEDKWLERAFIPDRRRGVRVVTDVGTLEFASQGEAAKYLGVGNTTMSRALNGDGWVLKKWKVERID